MIVKQSVWSDKIIEVLLLIFVSPIAVGIKYGCNFITIINFLLWILIPFGGLFHGFYVLGYFK